jgi:hypothetical protein
VYAHKEKYGYQFSLAHILKQIKIYKHISPAVSAVTILQFSEFPFGVLKQHAGICV